MTTAEAEEAEVLTLRRMLNTRDDTATRRSFFPALLKAPAEVASGQFPVPREMGLPDPRFDVLRARVAKLGQTQQIVHSALSLLDYFETRLFVPDRAIEDGDEGIAFCFFGRERNADDSAIRYATISCTEDGIRAYRRDYDRPGVTTWPLREHAQELEATVREIRAFLRK